MNPLQKDPEHRTDKLALFVLAALVVTVLGVIVVGVLWSEEGVPDKADVLLGGISTGLILFLQRLVDAVRSSWEEVTRGKQIEASTQTVPAELAVALPGVLPSGAGPTGNSDDPVHVTEDVVTFPPKKGT